MAAVVANGRADAQAPNQPDESDERPAPGVISRQRSPLNAEFPFPTLDSFLTPNEQFYIRTHFDVPQLKADQWTLQVEGHVEHPFAISYDELRKEKAKTLVSLLECSGNSRVLLDPPQVSIRWEQGGVSNAEWTGVPLSTILERAGVRQGAVEVILEGHDQGSFAPPQPKTPGKIHYARSLPIDAARRPEVLLAHQMNGKDLPPEHGFPVRAVVAGWYGMASVKWLRRIVVVDRPFHGMFQTFMYSIWERRFGLPTLVPVTEIGVKAQIARPMFREVVRGGSTYRIHGAAWSGRPEIAKVEISTDGGKSWSEAELAEKSMPFAWRFFEHRWNVPRRAGRQTLMARATDDRGNVQPMERDQDRRNAMINHVQAIEVYVE
ncbi:MAG TPA: sulfite oxidase [Pirellulales bacterium]|nr:sulfite oxidase [Pirellulales bacterium]